MDMDTNITDNYPCSSEDKSGMSLFIDLNEGNSDDSGPVTLMPEHIQLSMPTKCYNDEFNLQNNRDNERYDSILIYTFPMDHGLDLQKHFKVPLNEIIKKFSSFSFDEGRTSPPSIQDAKNFVYYMVETIWKNSRCANGHTGFVHVKELEAACLAYYEDAIKYSSRLIDSNLTEAFDLQRDIESSINDILSDYNYVVNESECYSIREQFSLRNHLTAGVPYYDDGKNESDIWDAFTGDELHHNIASQTSNQPTLATFDSQNENTETETTQYRTPTINNNHIHINYFDLKYNLPADSEAFRECDHISVPPHQTVLASNIDRPSEALANPDQQNKPASSVSLPSLSTSQQSSPTTSASGVIQPISPSLHSSTMTDSQISQLQNFTSKPLSGPDYIHIKEHTDSPIADFERSYDDHLLAASREQNRLLQEESRLADFDKAVSKYRDSPRQTLILADDQLSPHFSFPRLEEFRIPNDISLEDVENCTLVTYSDEGNEKTIRYSYEENKKFGGYRTTPYQPKVHRKEVGTRKGNFGLCPYCQPTVEQLKNGCLDYFFWINQSNYLHHLTKQHGVFSNGTFVENPDGLVWAVSKKSRTAAPIEAIVCPFEGCGQLIKLSKYDEKSPNKNRFLEYLRHVNSDHAQGKNNSRRGSSR